ncbi:MAG: hypothetical protein K8F56_16840, partial [Rhodocyclaceae bacterium]|nr:hypothetical protein [Rhodocyclaceae bacterium]
MLRRLLERLTRGAVLRRTLPAEFRSQTLYVSPDARPFEQAPIGAADRAEEVGEARVGRDVERLRAELGGQRAAQHRAAGEPFEQAAQHRPGLRSRAAC